jgi:glycosyltransferase involved in cell wall biosynthesis
MKILFCNKYHFEFSGTEVYLFDLMRLLERGGHEVAAYAMTHPRNRPARYEQHFAPYADFKRPGLRTAEKMRLAARMVYSRSARAGLGRVIDDFAPDVAHVRNIYHHLSPSIFWELRRRGVPVVYHLNDFKMICPNYNLVSGERVCERCAGSRFWHVVTENCHGGGIAAGLTLAAEAYLHRWIGTYAECVDRFVAPSVFCRDKLVERGVPAEKIAVVPHFQAIPPEADLDGQDDYILCAGRVSAEKGIRMLIEAIGRLPAIPLLIVGDGPQRPELEALVAAKGIRNVRFVGHAGREELYRLIRRARFTVMPSLVFETLGKVILESYALGRAVVASDLGTRPELVDHGRTGLLFAPGNVDDLEQQIAALYAQPDLARAMGEEGSRRVADRHSPERHYDEMVRIYDEVRAA